MILGILSDTHISNSNVQKIPQKILEDFKRVDMIIHAGDLIDLSVLEQLRSSCDNIKAVSGNMDPEEVRKKLPQKEIIKINNHKIGVMHGWGPPNNLVELLTREFKDDGVDIIIFGHSHHPLNEKRGNILFFNPGSTMDKIFAPYNSYGIMEINDKIEAKVIKI